MAKVWDSPLTLIAGLLLLGWGGVVFVETAIVPRMARG